MRREITRVALNGFAMLLGVTLMQTILAPPASAEVNINVNIGAPPPIVVHHRPTMFEPYSSVVARASEALADVAVRTRTLDPPAALVVAHSGLVRSLIRHLGGIDTRIPNLGGVWFTASVIDGRSDLSLGDVFDPAGVVVTGVDAPGEDPGEEADEADTERAAEC